MKTNTNKGFTLIELIMVIVILGILAAVAVPKFFAITDQAHTKNQEAVIGNIKSGLQLYAAHQLVTYGSRSYPPASESILDTVLEKIPTGWAYTPADSLITYSGVTPVVTYQYTSVGGTVGGQ